MPAREPSPAERLIAAAVYAPIGLGAEIVDEVPKAVDRIRQRLVLARFLGKMAVDQGTREVQRRLAAAGTRPTAPSDVPADVPAATVATDEPDVPVPVVDDDPPDAGDVEELALPDYDLLPASQIVGRLESLTAAERADIEAYELANRHRRTVLGKLEQLAEA